jgi:hypothetical protein
MRLQIYVRKHPRVGRRIAQRKEDGRYGLLLRFVFLRIIVWERDRGRIVQGSSRQNLHRRAGDGR